MKAHVIIIDVSARREDDCVSTLLTKAQCHAQSHVSATLPLAQKFLFPNLQAKHTLAEWQISISCH